MTPSHVRKGPNGRHGFTLVELLVVMVIIATLLTLAVPRYLGNVEKSKEAVLKQNLALTRDALEKYYADRGAYPPDLQELVSAKYLRALPFDPITERNDSWQAVAPANAVDGGVYDLRSGSRERARDGSYYKDW